MDAKLRMKISCLKPMMKNKIIDFFDNLTIQSKRVRTHTLYNGIEVVQPFSKTPLIILVLFILTALSWNMTRVNLWNLFSRFGNFFDILIAMTKPRWPYINSVIKPMVDTIQMSFLGSFLGAIFALPIAFLAAGNINKNKLTLNLARLMLSLVRTLPVLVYAAIFSLIFGFGTFSGTLAIAVFTFALMSKMVYEQIETIDLGPFIAIEATGATKAKAFVAAIIPQIMPSYLSFSLYSLEINIRFAAILGYVGAGGIGLLLDQRMAFRRYEDVAVVLVVLFVVVFLIESLSRYLRKRLT
jgi:phosphonate transport system permease protein